MVNLQTEPLENLSKAFQKPLDGAMNVEKSIF
jgi:hypothetical protein